MNNSVGDVMRTGNRKAWKAIAGIGSVLVYLGYIAYSAVHNWNLLTAGVHPDWIWVVGVGVLALEITAVCLPLALHFWFHAPLQKIWGYGFYALVFGLVSLNIILDFASATGLVAPAWMDSYRLFVVPTTPVFAAIGWAVVWFLDPEHRRWSMIENTRAAAEEALTARIAEEARSADISSEVQAAAATMARDIVRQTLGAAVNSVSPRNVVDVSSRDATPARKRNPLAGLGGMPKRTRIDTNNLDTMGMDDNLLDERLAGFFGPKGESGPPLQKGKSG